MRLVHWQQAHQGGGVRGLLAVGVGAAGFTYTSSAVCMESGRGANARFSVPSTTRTCCLRLAQPVLYNCRTACANPAPAPRCPFCPQSMFNQPADELSAKGGKGEAKGADGSVLRPQLRGTTGMARGSVPQDDKDGGAAPPPLMPKPTPRRQ